jgi:hypothetical protein
MVDNLGRNPTICLAQVNNAKFRLYTTADGQAPPQ